MATWVVALLVSALFCPVAFADDFQSRMEQQRRLFEERRREFDQRHAEMQRRFDQQRASSFGTTAGTAASSAQRGVQTYGAGRAIQSTTTAGGQMLPRRGATDGSHTYSSAATQQRALPAQHSDRMRGTSIDPLPFDAKKAPSPDLCFLKFVAIAKGARSMDEILPYVPFAQQRVIKETQQQWNPQQAAAKRADWKRRSPSMSEDSLDHLTGAPYVRELKHYQGVATKVMRVMNVKITAANKAELKVATENTLSTNAYGKWEDFPYSTANVEMLGEGDYWRMSSYNDNNVHYKEPQ